MAVKSDPYVCNTHTYHRSQSEEVLSEITTAILKTMAIVGLQSMSKFKYSFIFATGKEDRVSVLSFATLTSQTFDVNMLLSARRRTFLQLPSLSALFLRQQYSQKTKQWPILCTLSINFKKEMSHAVFRAEVADSICAFQVSEWLIQSSLFLY